MKAVVSRSSPWRNAAKDSAPEETPEPEDAPMTGVIRRPRSPLAAVGGVGSGRGSGSGGTRDAAVFGQVGAYSCNPNGESLLQL